jgi:NDP-sugar pyrophosphorylase family protein
MKKPILLIMAAGMGSRFGGPKQIEPIDEHDHVILDFSVFDAIRAGFEKVVLIIKKEMEQDFEERVGKRIRPHVQLEYAFQSLDKLPEGYAIPEGRVKPWGTAHAILCAKDKLDAPFAVLNADDFYGADAYKKIYQFLSAEHAESEYAMVGYQLGNTLSDFGSVARGVCEIGPDGKLVTLTERLKIEKRDGAAAFTEDDGATYTPLALDTLVSMNLFGLQRNVLDEFENRFPAFLDENLPKNPLKCEYLLPRVLDTLMQEGKISIEVLETSARWHGITNRPDLPILKAAIRKMKDEGQYPEELWK